MKKTIILIFIFCIVIIPCFVQETSNPNMVSMTFRNADIQDVIKFVSEVTGKCFLTHENVKGTVTVISTVKIPTDLTLDVLESILEMLGYSLVKTDDVIKIMPIDLALKKNMPIIFSNEHSDTSLSGDRLITQIFQLSNINAHEIINDIQPLISPYAKIFSNKQANLIILTDIISNIEKIAELLKKIDNASNNKNYISKIIQIKNSNSTEIYNLLQNLYKKNSNPQFETKSFFNYEINNSILITGVTKEECENIKTMIESLDIVSGFPAKIFFLKYADCGSFSVLLENFIASGGTPFGGRQNKIIKYEPANAIILLYKDKMTMDIAEMFISQFDIPNTDKTSYTKMYKLNYAAIDEAIHFFEELFSQKPNASIVKDIKDAEVVQSKPYKIIPYKKLNSFYITTYFDKYIKMIDELLPHLDNIDCEIISGEEVTTIFNLQNAKCENIAEALDKVFRKKGDEDLETSGKKKQENSKSEIKEGDKKGTDSYIQSISGKLKIIPYKETNSLLITTLPANIQKIKKLIDGLDIMPAQVLIEVIIAEVNMEALKNAGVSFTYSEKSSHLGKENLQGTIKQNFNITEQRGITYSILKNNIDVLIQALQQNSKIDILSAPKILTSDNKKAHITIGEEIPYITGTVVNTEGKLISTAYAYKDVAMILEVEPHISQNKFVHLDIHHEIKSVLESTVFNAPRINKRETQTSAVLKDGSTLVIGGIMKTDKTAKTSGVPIVSDIPILGNLFKYSSTTDNKTELLIFITPYVILNSEDSEKITKEQKEKVKYLFDNK